MKNGQSAVYFQNQAHGDDIYLSKTIRDNGKVVGVLDVVMDGVSVAKPSQYHKGKHASGFAYVHLENCTIDARDRERGINNVVACLMSVNEEIFNRTDFTATTTVTGALKLGDDLFYFNIGDSPGYLIRGDDHFALATMDKYAEDELLPPTMDHRSALKNVLGFRPELNLHGGYRKLQPGDKLIIYTDGIADNVPDETVIRIMKQAKSPEKAKQME